MGGGSLACCAVAVHTVGLEPGEGLGAGSGCLVDQGVAAFVEHPQDGLADLDGDDAAGVAQADGDAGRDATLGPGGAVVGLRRGTGDLGALQPGSLGRVRTRVVVRVRAPSTRTWTRSVFRAVFGGVADRRTPRRRTRRARRRAGRPR